MELPTKHKNALKLLASRLDGIPWVLIGSTNLAAQGVEVEPHDIDILTDKEGAYKIEARLKEFTTQPVSYSKNERFASHYGRFLVLDVEVEVMGDLKNNSPRTDLWGETEGFNEVLELDMDGVKIPAVTLRREYEAYTKMGRMEKAEKIKDRLTKESLH